MIIISDCSYIRELDFHLARIIYLKWINSEADLRSVCTYYELLENITIDIINDQFDLQFNLTESQYLLLQIKYSS